MAGFIFQMESLLELRKSRRDECRAALGFRDQREVSGVKRTHRRYEADALSARPRAIADPAQVGGPAKDGRHRQGTHRDRPYPAASVPAIQAAIWHAVSGQFW